jgi:hypothetical protein
LLKRYEVGDLAARGQIAAIDARSRSTGDVFTRHFPRSVEIPNSALAGRLRRPPARCGAQANLQQNRYAPAAVHYSEEKAPRALKPNYQPDLRSTPPGTATYKRARGSDLVSETPAVPTGVFSVSAGNGILPPVWATSHQSGQPLTIFNACRRKRSSIEGVLSLVEDEAAAAVFHSAPLLVMEIVNDQLA